MLTITTIAGRYICLRWRLQFLVTFSCSRNLCWWIYADDTVRHSCLYFWMPILLLNYFNKCYFKFHSEICECYLPKACVLRKYVHSKFRSYFTKEESPCGVQISEVSVHNPIPGGRVKLQAKKCKIQIYCLLDP